MKNGALSDLKVVEYSQFISGPWCAKSLADFGAEVIKVEEPGTGDQARSMGPFPDDIPHPEKSGLFLYLNTSKLGVTLNLKTKAGLKIFKELIREADILVENNPPRLIKELGIDYESLKKVNPRLIMTSVTPFGQTGPYRDYKACDLITMQMGQCGYVSPYGVEDLEKQPPLKHGGHQAHITAAATAALVTMFAIFNREKSGSGEHIDISEQECVANEGCTGISGLLTDGVKDFRKRSERSMPNRALPCKDGFVFFFLLTEPQWEGFKSMIGSSLDWATGDLYKDRWSRNANWDSLEPAIMEGLAKLTREEIIQAGREKHFPIGPLNTAEDVVKSEQLASRGFFVDIEHPEVGKIRLPGLPSQMSQTPWQVSRPAPLLGQHNEEILCHRLGYSKADLVRMRQAGII
ncbi:MAG: CoA transferase [Dehalococcoidales bacterium]|nr:CoA transferase [Dehalococcoidales bacterium]